MPFPILPDQLDPGATIGGWSAWGAALGRELDYQHFLRRFGSIYAEVGGFRRTRMAWQRFGQLGAFAERVAREQLAGDYAEFGTWRGGSLYLVARLWRDLGFPRDLLGFDSFQGLPAPDPLRDGHRIHAGMFSDVDYDEVVGFFKAQELSRVHLVRGWFHETIKTVRDRPLSLCHIDADCYESVRFVLENVYENIVPGGYVVVDDYRHPDCSGATIAVEEFFARRQEVIRQVPGIDCSCWIQKENNRLIREGASA